MVSHSSRQLRTLRRLRRIFSLSLTFLIRLKSAHDAMVFLIEHIDLDDIPDLF
jgi:hypothetical protein